MCFGTTGERLREDETWGGGDVQVPPDPELKSEGWVEWRSPHWTRRRLSTAGLSGLFLPWEAPAWPSARQPRGALWWARWARTDRVRNTSFTGAGFGHGCQVTRRDGASPWVERLTCTPAVTGTAVSLCAPEKRKQRVTGDFLSTESWGLSPSPLSRMGLEIKMGLAIENRQHPWLLPHCALN